MLIGVFEVGHADHKHFRFVRLAGQPHEETSKDAFATPVDRRGGPNCYIAFSENCILQAYLAIFALCG
jgi:hypothetical protein